MNFTPSATSEAIGLFGGTFDPVHFGHLILAREAAEKLGLGRVIWIPAAVSPFKIESPPAPGDLRLAMVRAAIADEPNFEADPIELFREGPSFAIDTVRAIQARHPKAKLFYFIGDDNVPDLDKWKNIDLLRRMVQFVVLTRHDPDVPHDFPVIRREIDISSTEIRNRVAVGRSIRYLLPESACRMIQEHGLYLNE